MKVEPSSAAQQGVGKGALDKQVDGVRVKRGNWRVGPWLRKELVKGGARPDFEEGLVRTEARGVVDRAVEMLADVWQECVPVLVFPLSEGGLEASDDAANDPFCATVAVGGAR